MKRFQIRLQKPFHLCVDKPIFSSSETFYETILTRVHLACKLESQERPDSTPESAGILRSFGAMLVKVIDGEVLVNGARVASRSTCFHSAFGVSPMRVVVPRQIQSASRVVFLSGRATSSARAFLQRQCNANVGKGPRSATVRVHSSPAANPFTLGPKKSKGLAP